MTRHGPDIDVSGCVMGSHYQHDLTPDLPARIICPYSCKRLAPDDQAALFTVASWAGVCPNPSMKRRWSLATCPTLRSWRAFGGCCGLPSSPDANENSESRRGGAGGRASRQQIEDLYKAAEATADLRKAVTVRTGSSASSRTSSDVITVIPATLRLEDDGLRD
jgi:hypothetical protein